MNKTTIDNDLAIIAARRGLTLTQRNGMFVCRDARRVIRKEAATDTELRRWLQSIESVLITKGFSA